MPFQFEDFVLDPERRELRRSDAAIAVEPQVFDLLHFLIRERERVVTKDDLLDAVWNGRVVSESTLTSRINAARRAVNDSGEEQRLIRTVPRKGFRFVGAVRDDAPVKANAAPSVSAHQDVVFCKTPSGINLAVASVGSGVPLVKTANWLNHIERDWQSPIWSPVLRRLGSRYRFIRYDGRGNGLSDWDVGDISFADFEQDLETVVDGLKLDRFALFGMSQGAATALSYAARHPERVTKLILYGAYPLGRNRRSPMDSEMAKAMLTIMRQGWGDKDSAFMKAFSSVYLPDGSPEELGWFADMQRASTSAENAARLRVTCDNIDVMEQLPRVTVPTLVLHGRHDNVAPFDQGRLVATAISGARFVALESKNHLPIPTEPAWERMMSEIEKFMEQ